MFDSKTEFVEAHKRFVIGDAITDDELMSLRMYYMDLLELIEVLGPEFDLFINECRRRFYVLDGYQRARKERNTPSIFNGSRANSKD